MSSSSEPIPITSSRNSRLSSPPPQYSFEVSPRTMSNIPHLNDDDGRYNDHDSADIKNDGDDDDVNNGIPCPPAFLPREIQNSEIHLDFFHHPAELYSPTEDLNDPLTNSDSGMANLSGSPKINNDTPSSYNQYNGNTIFENARSPVLAIHHSRRPSSGPFSPEDETNEETISKVVSGLSLSNNDATSPSRRVSSVASETTYVPMTPLPSNCCLSFFDRPNEMATLIHKNAELFTLIEHTVSPETYQELNTLWKTPRDVVPDEDWVKKTREYISMGPDEGNGGGALWARWKELIGWESDDDDDELGGNDEYDWNYQPQNTSLFRRWSEVEKARTTKTGEEGTVVGSFGSGIGLSAISGVGTGLGEIKEGEEEEMEDGERPTTMKNSKR